MLKRKVDKYLINWKLNKERKPLIINGARQIGKTTSIRKFGESYASFIEINFATMPQYKNIFKNSYEVKDIIKEISLLNSKSDFIDNNTLIFFDEIQECPDATTTLKSFSLDGRFDVICSGSLLGVHYKRISSIPVGFKDSYNMHSLDFEEFLWALGYKENQIDDIFENMKLLKPLSPNQLNQLQKLYRDYIFVGGMPEVVNSFVINGTFNKPFYIQNRLLKDYEDDVTKYIEGLDVSKVKNVYKHISSQLFKENHKFQITKLGHGARFREYMGIEEWLSDAGIVNVIHNINSLSLPLNSNEIINDFRMYYQDHSFFFANLDEESKDDIIINNHFDIYNGAFYESLISEELIKSGYELYFYKNNDSTIELDFLIRVKNYIVPIEVKKERGRSKSLNCILNSKINNIKYGIKFTDGNIGYSDNKFTFPYFLSFLLKRFFKETNYIKWD